MLLNSITAHAAARLRFNSLQLLSLPLVVAEEVSVLAGVNVFVNLQQEPLVEFEGLEGERIFFFFNQR